MREVFTLWPGEGGSVPDRDVNADGMPMWALRPGGRAQPPSWTRRDWQMLAIIVALVRALALVVPVDLASTIAAGLLVAIAIGLAVLGLVMHRREVSRLHRELEDARSWNEVIFERTGISLWREDWTAARDEVLRLLQSGVRDMQAYFASRPDELREIRRRVIIKDVNAFGVKRAGATSKADLTGSLDRLLPDTDQTFVQWLVAFAQGDSFYRSETHITQADGTPVDTLFTAGLPRDMEGFKNILVSDLDITEYKATQARLAEAERDVARAARVTTMGVLSASIAHEVNSPLAAIVSNAEASLRWLERNDPDFDEASAALKEVIASAKRAQTVVERTRAFLTNTPATLEVRDIVQLVQESIVLIDRELRALGVTTHVNATDGLPPVKVDAVSIQQVLVNLMMNAAQAMEGVSGTRDLRITIAEIGDRIRIDVRDRGSGIEPDRLGSVFDPFYSTKGNGMGMGLAICKNGVEKHGGKLWVSSSLGEGSTFHFDLPIAGEQLAAIPS